MADLTLEDFFINLPGKISQARRQLFTYNDNLLEFWTRRLEDYLNVLNVFYQRLRQNVNIQEGDDIFLQNVVSNMEEIQKLHARFENNAMQM